MSTQQLRNRVRNVEERVCPKQDGLYTLEELFRRAWRQDKKKYLEMVEEGNYFARSFMSQFEQEDEARLSK